MTAQHAPFDLEARVRERFEPLILAETEKLVEIGEAARHAAIEQALASVGASPSEPVAVQPNPSAKRHPVSAYWSKFTPEERSAILSERRRKGLRKKNSVAPRDTVVAFPSPGVGPRHHSLVAALAGVPRNGQRSPLDFYVTPPECTQALLEAEGVHVSRFVALAEPFCGEGHISKVLESAGFVVSSTDLIDRGYGDGGVDAFERFPLERAIVTNPPFSRAHEFIRRALEDERVEYLALMLKASFFNSQKSARLMQDHPPSRLYPLSWRPQCIPGPGRATLFDFQWVVWDTARAGEAVTRALLRPAQGQERFGREAA